MAVAAAAAAVDLWMRVTMIREGVVFHVQMEISVHLRM